MENLGDTSVPRCRFSKGSTNEGKMEAQDNYRKACCLQQHIPSLTEEGDPVSHESSQLAEQAKAEKVAIQKATETQEVIFTLFFKPSHVKQRIDWNFREMHHVLWKSLWNHT